VIQKRCLRHNLKIDRSNFYAIGAHEMLQLFDGVSRIISQKDPDRAKYDDGKNGLNTISKLNYSIDKESLNPGDNIYLHEIENVSTLFINIRAFITETPVENETYVKKDIFEPLRNYYIGILKKAYDLPHIVLHCEIDSYFDIDNTIRLRLGDYPDYINLFKEIRKQISGNINNRQYDFKCIYYSYIKIIKPFEIIFNWYTIYNIIFMLIVILLSLKKTSVLYT
jgi:hypothetical protein